VIFTVFSYPTWKSHLQKLEIVLHGTLSNFNVLSFLSSRTNQQCREACFHSSTEDWFIWDLIPSRFLSTGFICWIRIYHATVSNFNWAFLQRLCAICALHICREYKVLDGIFEFRKCSKLKTSSTVASLYSKVGCPKRSTSAKILSDKETVRDCMNYIAI